MMSDALARLELLLDALHEALMAGDVGALAPLADAMEQVFDAEGSALRGAFSGHDGMRLRAKAARNAANLEAMRRGIRAASRRIAEIAATARGLQTYDIQGRRQIVTPEGGDIARRM